MGLAMEDLACTNGLAGTSTYIYVHPTYGALFAHLAQDVEGEDRARIASYQPSLEGQSPLLLQSAENEGSVGHGESLNNESPRYTARQQRHTWLGEDASTQRQGPSRPAVNTRPASRPASLRELRMHNTVASLCVN